jgi:hypothetical protein
MECFFSTFIHKIFYLIVVTILGKNIGHRDRTDCEIKTIQSKEKVFLQSAQIIVNALKLNRN